MKKAFSLLELIFVLIIIAIILALSLSNNTVSKDDAVFLKSKSTILSIQNSLALLKSKASFNGEVANLDKLDNNIDFNKEGKNIFYFEKSHSSNMLQRPLLTSKSNGEWMKVSANKYVLQIENYSLIFKYENYMFSCLGENEGEALLFCKKILQ